MLVEAIALRVKVPADRLRKIAANASRRYHEFPILKRDGTERIIAHPSRPLKALQRFLARNIYGVAPIHVAATAYVKGSSIRDNASRHAGYRFTVRLDFADFFPSFDHESVKIFSENLCRINSIPVSGDDINFIAKIVCRNGSLPIGAPSSPRITNAMMYDFDLRVFNFCESMNVVYSRYADDIFLSGNDSGALNQCVGAVRQYVESHQNPPLRLKEEKTLYLSKANHRSVTGLVLTPDGKISLGRDRKREIKTLLYLAINKKLNLERKIYLCGMIAFCADVEPDFLRSLGQKFQIDVLSFVKKI